MRNLKKISLTFLLLSSFIYTGCTNYEGPTYGEKILAETDESSLHRLNSVAILDKDLQEWSYWNSSNKHSSKSKISVENLGIKSLKTRNVEVFTTIRNRTDYPLQLSIRTQFYDDNKISNEEPTAWKRMSLPQNSSMTYKERSITIDDVTNFLIEVKEGD